MGRSFVTKLSANREYYFYLRDDSNKIILRAGKTYKTKQGCNTGIISVRAHAPFDKNYTRFDDQEGNPTFGLEDADGEAIGIGESYDSVQGREKGIQHVKQCAPNAPAVDDHVTGYDRWHGDAAL